ncbi:MAG TPA: hypothetical protein VLJ14_01285 [Ktedonobacterales bacterium]|nr:hypothetical protein [Ktedonobacterales bacterium]
MSAYEFVEREKAAHPVCRLCRVLGRRGVSPSGSWALVTSALGIG